MWLAAVAAFAGAAVQSATGLGFALVLSPALFAVMEPAEAVTAVLLLGAALCSLVLVESRRVTTHGLGRLLVPALPGLAVGMVLLTALSKEPLQVGVGVAVIAAAGWQLWHPAPRPLPGVGRGRAQRSAHDVDQRQRAAARALARGASVCRRRSSARRSPRPSSSWTSRASL